MNRQNRGVGVVAADNHLARIYRRVNSHIELIGEAEPEKNSILSEINNKTVGRMKNIAGGSAHHKFEPSENASTYQKMIFTNDISNFLEKIEKENTFDKIIIIAPPKMLGDLRKILSPHVKDRIVAEFDKDLTKLNDNDFKAALQKIIWF